ncbi:PA2169 family four-helix-bundle protein [Pseudomonas subflava]|uniref:PA2169 family four-helix-bundle protein n=1 Tax=Pseudomonas subflava TaxID=2952933 RepID=UPI00207AEF24|nr:PA2169 family four-helix-bundle protein [Pseudomonas subflava]
MSRETAQLDELIEITRDGELLYSHAAEAVSDRTLAGIFLQMAEAKRRLVEALSLALAERHEQPPRGGTLIGSLQRLYADARARLADDDGNIYVEQLADVEERLLQAFEEARHEAPAEWQGVLDREMPNVRACHARMLELKGSN